ncbi:hypothetical protein ACH3XW_37870 [Acanthocheilonema viteae]
MTEDGRNISDDMSSLLHAAEEWANDLNDPISYPVYVPIKEFARQIVLEICKIYNWDPETGTDIRLLKRNAGDTTNIQQSTQIPGLHNIFRNANYSPSITKLDGNNSAATPKIPSPAKYVKNHQQETLLHTVQSSAATCDDTVNKTFAVSQNTSLNKPEQLDTSHQIIHNNHTINKTFTVKKFTALGGTKKSNAYDQIIHDNLKQKSGKVAMSPVMDTTQSSVKDAFYDNKISAVHKAEKNSYISSKSSDIMNKNRVPNSEEHSEMPEKLIVNSTQNTGFSPTNINYQQFADNDFITSTPQMKSSKKNQKILEMHTIRNSGSNDICSGTVHGGGNTVNTCCVTESSSNIIATKNVITVLTPNETVIETSMFTTNEITKPTFSKASSVNDGDITRNIAILSEITNLPENSMSIPGTVIIANSTLQQFPHYSTEKENDLQVINSMQINASQNDALYHTSSEEKLNEKLSCPQISDNLLQYVIQKSQNHNFISTIATTHSGKCLLVVTENPNAAAVEEFKNITQVNTIPKINTTTQTESSTYPCDSKNYANLERNINVKNTSQKQLIIDDEDKNLMINKTAIADNQIKVAPCHPENCIIHCSNRQAFQPMIQNISMNENDRHFKDMTEKKLITRAIQTNLEIENKSFNDSCDKFDSTPSRGKRVNISGNNSFNTSLPIMNSVRDRFAKKAIAKRTFRGMPNFNKPGILARQTIKRPKINREIMRKPSTMMTSKPAAKIAKLDVKQNLKPVHRTRPVNPPKKPNELPLENRASRLKAEYLAKKRAEQAKKLQMMKSEKITVDRLSVMRKFLSFGSKSVAKSENAKKSNISPRLNVSNQTSTFEKKILSPISEISTAAERLQRLENI